MVQSISIPIQKKVKKLFSNGKSTREISKILSISQSTVSRITRKQPSAKKLKSKCRSRKLHKHDERYICRLAITGKCSTATQIKKELSIFGGIKVSSKTILRSLRRNKIKSRYKVKKPQLTKVHKMVRREFEKTHRSWDESDWDKVIWSDETKISLFGSDGRERTFKKDGQPLQDHHIHPTKKFGGGSLMVWGCMLSSGVGYLCRVNGGVNAEMYINILNDELMETISWYGLNKKSLVFQQDNASCHTASVVKKWFEENNINVMKWPSQSPDLNPIEHLWDHLKRKVREAPYCHDLDELWDQVQDIWNAIDGEVCLRLVRSMPRRLEEIKKAKGGYTKY